MRHIYSGSIFFSRGFRPFFLSAGVFAGIAMPVWVMMLAWGIEIPSAYAMREWHFHEMVFGYVPAVISGFLLTAIPNWTGRPPLVGKSLIGLWVLWVAGRFSMSFGADYQAQAAAIDSLYLVFLSLIIWREIIGGRNLRNTPIGILVSMIAIANLVFHYKIGIGEPSEMLERLALSVIAMLLSVVGGRITPVFTTNWMKKNRFTKFPVASNRFDILTLVVTLVALISWVVQPAEKTTGVLFGVAALVSFLRIIRWRGWETFSEPLVLILHIGHFWLTVWFELMAGSIFYPDVISQSTALHALTAGAVGTMTLAVMTRASLGHAGLPLKAGLGAIIIYGSVLLGALFRVSAEWQPFEYTTTMVLAGSLWSFAFLLFVVLWSPVFFQSE